MIELAHTGGDNMLSLGRLRGPSNPCPLQPFSAHAATGHTPAPIERKREEAFLRRTLAIIMAAESQVSSCAAVEGRLEKATTYSPPNLNTPRELGMAHWSRTP